MHENPAIGFESSDNVPARQHGIIHITHTAVKASRWTFSELRDRGACGTNGQDDAPP